MKTPILLLLLLLVSAIMTGCGSSPGPDSISSHRPQSPGAALDCVACHSSAIFSRRQIFGAGGDFGANTNLVSHHVASVSDPSSDQCLVCHDQSTHMFGTVLLKHADTGASIAYDPADPSSLEPFCLSCHDVDAATITFVIGGAPLNPFNDGRVLGVMPDAAGNKIASYWNDTYTVHKNNGLTCAGAGGPLTGCHGNMGTINMHGSASKGILTKNLTLPLSNDSPYSYEDYKLCFDCHESYPAVSKEVVLGYRVAGNYDVWWAPTPYYTSDIQSLFRDRWIRGDTRAYNNTIWGDQYIPLHNYHLSPTDVWMNIGIWKYRGNQVGRISCIACHNVHGTPGTIRSTHVEFGLTAFTAGPDAYKKLVPDSNYEDPVFKAYPIYCNISCHGIVPNTSYWYTPSDE